MLVNPAIDALSFWRRRPNGRDRRVMGKFHSCTRRMSRPCKHTILIAGQHELGCRMAPSSSSPFGKARLVKRLLVAAGCLAGLTLCAASPVAAQAPGTKTVLAIYSQGRDTAIDAFDASLRNTLRTVSGDTVTYYAEFMDTSRFAGDQQLALFRDFLSRKYDRRTMDAVVLVGRGAAKVVSGDRPLFAGVPTVFYTLDQADVEAPAGAVRLVGTFADDER